MSELALNVGVANSGKEYAIRKPQQAPQQQEQAVLAGQGMRESGVEWQETKNSEFSLMRDALESQAMLMTSTTDTSAKFARSGMFSQEMLADLKNKFKKAFVAAYGNIFSHNRLLAKVSEWLVGNVMERLALMGIALEELAEIKSSVREEIKCRNRTAMAQVIYDETLHEVLT